jgi:hypothetical protein
MPPRTIASRVQPSRSCKRRVLAASETVLQAITERNQRDSSFLQLPGEIRNAIYQYALGGCELWFTSFHEGEPKFIDGPGRDSPWAHLLPVSKSLAVYLPLACRQIRVETGAHSMLKRNTFHMVGPGHSARLVRPLTTEHIAKIEVVHMTVVRLIRYYMENGSPCYPVLRLPCWKRLVLTGMNGLSVQDMEEIAKKLKKKHTVLKDLQVEIRDYKF